MPAPVFCARHTTSAAAINRALKRAASVWRADQAQIAHTASAGSTHCRRPLTLSMCTSTSSQRF